MKIVGHRGARGLAPENTIAALEKGVEHHADMLEFDLRVTKDGVVILHHDPELRDPSGARFRINQHTFEELKKHKPDLARLEELLQANSKVPLYLEIKPGEPVDPIAKLLKDKNPKTTYVASKSQKTLLEAHKLLPELPKVVIHPWSGVIATHRARQVGTAYLSMNRLWLWSGFIKSITRGGYKLFAYTLNDPAKVRRWSKSGLAGVVTDYPDRFEKLVK